MTESKTSKSSGPAKSSTSAGTGSALLDALAASIVHPSETTARALVDAAQSHHSKASK